MTTQPTVDRRRRDILGRLARATWPARESMREFADDLGDLPCQIFGHRWCEVPEALRKSKVNDGKKMRFKCSRCYMTAGFKN